MLPRQLVTEEEKERSVSRLPSREGLFDSFALFIRAVSSYPGKLRLRVLKCPIYLDYFYIIKCIVIMIRVVCIVFSCNVKQNYVRCRVLGIF